MAYTKQTWENLPSQTTPINADRLTHIEDGIFNAAATADTAASDASSAIGGLADKVDKVEGKGLSTNDFTDALKTKLDNIETGAEVNVQSDWSQSDNTKDDYIKNKPTLGTSAYKNSTSVVTQSTDLVESGAVKDLVGWSNKNKFDLNGYSISSNTTGTVLSDGINVKSSSASRASYIYFFKNVKNTDMRFKTILDFVSGHTQVIVYGNSTPATAGATSIISSDVYTADGNVDLQFYSGDYEYLIIRFFVTAGTAEVGEANFNSIMLCKASDGDTYEPYHASVEDTIPQVVSDAVGWDVNNEFKPTAKSGTSSDLTYRIDDDGVFFNGTTSAQVSLDYATVRLKAGTYVYTDDAVTSDRTYFMNVVPNPTILTGNLNINTKPLKFTLNQSATLVFKIYVRSGQTFNNQIVFKPKLVHVSVDESKCDNSVIGTVEDGTTASQAYGFKEHFTRNGKFCTVNTPISANEDLTNSSKFSSGDVADAITDLENGLISSTQPWSGNTLTFPMPQSNGVMYRLTAMNTNGLHYVDTILVNRVDGMPKHDFGEAITCSYSGENLVITLPTSDYYMYKMEQIKYGTK